MDTIKQLYKTLNERKRPEDVAQMILEILDGQLSPTEKNVLEKAAKGSLKNMFLGYTSMMQTFTTAVGAEKQVKKAIELFNLKSPASFNYNSISQIRQFIEDVSPIIHKNVGDNNFVADRLNREGRKIAGIELSKRSYNKKWRLLKRLERKLLKYTLEIKKIEFQKVAKHGLSHQLSLYEFQKDINSACFIAYYNARCNLRSVFTNTCQERAFDEISNMLLNRCNRKSTPGLLNKIRFREKPISTNKTNWWAIAHIYSSQEILDKLTVEEKGKLLGKWTSLLQEIAFYLRELWKSNRINRKTMVVQKGNDSSSWNHTAGAWNKVRDHWMHLIYSLGMDYILDEICFGKVLRLMAADVVAWHHLSGNQLHPNTEVWKKIPLPWEVFLGKKKCTKELVETYCKKAGLDAEKSGWIAPKKHGVAEFKPTPELVHGVMISNPYLASVLKRHKYFSGKYVTSFSAKDN